MSIKRGSSLHFRNACTLSMSYRTVLCISLLIMFLSGCYSTSYFLQDICRWTAPWYTVNHTKYPLFLCRWSSWICGSTRDSHSIDLLAIIVDFPCDCAILLTFFPRLWMNRFWYFVLSFLLEEGPNNWSSCCTFKKKRWRWMDAWCNSEMCHLMCQRLFFIFLPIPFAILDELDWLNKAVNHIFWMW